MATITKTPSKTWKAVVRKRGWPVTIKTFRTKRDAADWARSTEDEMVRGVYINRAGAERLLFDKALDRYLAEVSASKRQSTAYGESRKAKAIAWRARKRLCGRYRQLSQAGKNVKLACVAIARELVGFIWDIVRQEMLHLALQVTPAGR